MRIEVKYEQDFYGDFPKVIRLSSSFLRSFYMIFDIYSICFRCNLKKPGLECRMQPAFIFETRKL